MKDIKGMMDEAVEAGIIPGQKDMETKLLAALAKVINRDPDKLKDDLLGTLAESHFHFRDHREVFAAMKALHEAGDHVDQETVRAKIGDKWPDALKAVFDPAKADTVAAMTYMRTVIRRARIEHARDIGATFMTALDHPDADPEALIAALQEQAFDMARTDFLSPPVRTQAELTMDYLAEVSAPRPGLKTGFDYLDGIIRGLTPGLFVIAAPPSAGKTTFVNQLADQVAKLNEVPILFFSYEQSAFDLWVKSIARLSGIGNEDIRAGLVAKGQKDKVREAAADYLKAARWIKVIEGDRHQTADRIRLMARREKAKAGTPPVLVIDYLQIIPAAESMTDKRSEVDALVSDLRRIARDIGSPVIAISSMSRAEYDKARMSGFKESGGIEYGADIAAILTVQSESEDKTERTVKLSIIKNRNGRRGYVGLAYHTTRDQFEETDQGELGYLEALGKDEDQ